MSVDAVIADVRAEGIHAERVMDVVLGPDREGDSE
jgi:hypothetical protein